MAGKLTTSALVAWRAHTQWLARRADAPVAAVAAHAAGLQAQDRTGALLAVRARSRAATAADVPAALAAGDVVSTWLMRGTLHLVAAADVHWMLALFGARNAAAGARRRRQLGLDDDTCARALRLIPRVLAEQSPLPRAALVDRLARRGVPVDPDGQAPAHLTAYAAARGLICRGPELAGGEPGYVLLDAWVPAAPPLDPDAALARLTRRYVAAFGPAGPADLAAWSGLPLGQARHGFALAGDDLTEVAGGAFVPAAAGGPPDGGPPATRLVGPYDTYLLGYRDRGPVLPAAHARRIQAGGGVIHPAVLVDGAVVGTWRLRRHAARGDPPGRHDRDRLTVAVEPFGPLDPALVPALSAEAEDVGRFFAAPADLIIT
jgi:hypothetical protein